jgi:hypothetical protein
MPGDVVANRNDHVVVARDEMKTSFLVLAKCIASQVAAILHILTLTDSLAPAERPSFAWG